MRCDRLVVVILGVLTVGCAVSPYRQAESYLQHEEYEKVLNAYRDLVRPHMRQGKRLIYYDPEAVTVSTGRI